MELQLQIVRPFAESEGRREYLKPGQAVLAARPTGLLGLWSALWNAARWSPFPVPTALGVRILTVPYWYEEGAPPEMSGVCLDGGIVLPIHPQAQGSHVLKVEEWDPAGSLSAAWLDAPLPAPVVAYEAWTEDPWTTGLDFSLALPGDALNPTGWAYTGVTARELLAVCQGAKLTTQPVEQLLPHWAHRSRKGGTYTALLHRLQQVRLRRDAGRRVWPWAATGDPELCEVAQVPARAPFSALWFAWGEPDDEQPIAVAPYQQKTAEPKASQSPART